MEAHLIHFFFLTVGFVFGLTIWFWDSLKQRSFISYKSLIISILVIFTLLHASPLSLHMAYPHQSQDQTSSHPCCTPQAATLEAQVLPIAQILIPEHSEDVLTAFLPFQIITSINNRSPPIS